MKGLEVDELVGAISLFGAAAPQFPPLVPPTSKRLSKRRRTSDNG